MIEIMIFIQLCYADRMHLLVEVYCLLVVTINVALLKISNCRSNLQLEPQMWGWWTLIILASYNWYHLDTELFISLYSVII